MERMALLRALNTTGSITKAAKACNLSYKAAWDSLHTLQNLMNFPLFTSEIGGKGGGGSKLTAEAENLLFQWEQFLSVHEQILGVLERTMGQNQDLNPLSRLVLQTSARNQLSGKIKGILETGLLTEVTVDLSSGFSIVVQITKDSLNVMGLVVGAPILCLIKASAVQMARSRSLQAGLYQNHLSGKVVYLESTGSQAEIHIKCSESLLLVASLGKDEFVELDPKQGEELQAIISSSAVILASLSH